MEVDFFSYPVVFQHSLPHQTRPARGPLPVDPMAVTHPTSTESYTTMAALREMTALACELVAVI